jgi:hypothetical protein
LSRKSRPRSSPICASMWFAWSGVSLARWA